MTTPEELRHISSTDMPQWQPTIDTKPDRASWAQTQRNVYMIHFTAGSEKGHEGSKQVSGSSYVNTYPEGTWLGCGFIYDFNMLADASSA